MDLTFGCVYAEHVNHFEKLMNRKEKKCKFTKHQSKLDGALRPSLRHRALKQIFLEVVCRLQLVEHQVLVRYT